MQEPEQIADAGQTIGQEALPVRDRLLNAAEQVVARAGVSKLTLDSVAREAGVSKGGLLYHFPSKSALITAIVERLACQCESDQDQALKQNGNEAGAFARAYVAARIRKPDPREQPVHTALLAAAGTDSEYLTPFRQRLTQWQARLENDGIDPAVASIVRLAIDGLCLGRLLGTTVPEGDLQQQVIDKLIAMTLPPSKPESSSATNEEIHQ